MDTRYDYYIVECENENVAIVDYYDEACKILEGLKGSRKLLGVEDDQITIIYSFPCKIYR